MLQDSFPLYRVGHGASPFTHYDVRAAAIASAISGTYAGLQWARVRNMRTRGKASTRKSTSVRSHAGLSRTFNFSPTIGKDARILALTKGAKRADEVHDIREIPQMSAI